MTNNKLTSNDNLQENELVENTTTDKQLTTAQASYKNALILGLFALISTGLVAVTNLMTKEKIASETENALVRQLSKIVSSSDYDNNVFKSCIIVNDPVHLGSNNDQRVYRLRNNNKDFALMLTSTAPDGYSGKIEIAIVVSIKQEILGVNVLSHRETPGLGDKIDRNKSNWLNQFNGLSLDNLKQKNWKVQKDGGQFDALTGATITPRAIIKAVYNGLRYIKSSKEDLYSRKDNCYSKQDNL